MIYVIITSILDRKELGNFDPSGHLLCALTSYANWFQFFQFQNHLSALLKNVSSIDLDEKRLIEKLKKKGWI